MFIHTTKPIQSGFGKAPEAFNAVDVGSSSDELILFVIHSLILAIADIDQAIVTPPANGIDNAIQGDAFSDNTLQRGFTAACDDFCVDITVALEDAKDCCLAESATSSLAFNAPGAEVGFIGLEVVSERRLVLAILHNALTDASQIPIGCIVVKSRQRGDLSGVQIQRIQPDNLPKMALNESCTECIPIFHRHDSRLASFH